jgi:hypothetical protein
MADTEQAASLPSPRNTPSNVTGSLSDAMKTPNPSMATSLRYLTRKSRLSVEPVDQMVSMAYEHRKI